MSDSRKTVLVTGGAGFMASNLVAYLCTRYPGYRILVLDALTYAGRIENLDEQALRSGQCEFWYGDVRNGQLMDEVVSQSDLVVHMAAETHVTRSIHDNRLFFETDVLGTQSVANAVLRFRDRVERFIHVSSSEVYGTALTEQMDEDHPLNPLSPYAAAKCGADRLIYSYWCTYRIPAIVVRPFNNFGPRQHLKKVIPRFITSCLLGESLRVHGDGSAARDFLYVEDFCSALDLLLHVDREEMIGQVLNLGTGEHRTILELANAVREAMQPPDSPIESSVAGPGQVFRHTCDSRRARALLGWTPVTSFAHGLERTIQWYREHEPWWRAQLWMRHIPIVTAGGKRELH